MTAENLDGNSSANTTATTQSNKPVTQPTLPAATEKQVNDRGIAAITADFEDDFLRGFNLDDKEAQMRFQTHPYTPPQTTSQVANPSAEYKTVKPLNNRGITPVIASFGYDPQTEISASNTTDKSGNTSNNYSPAWAQEMADRYKPNQNAATSPVAQWQMQKQEEFEKDHAVFSPGKALVGAVEKGVQDTAQAFIDTLAFGEDLLWSPVEFLNDFEPGTISDDAIFNQWAEKIRENGEKVDAKHAENIEAGGNTGKLIYNVGSATVQAIPQAVMALLTGGASAVAQTTAGLQTAANAALSPGVVSTVKNIVGNMARDPQYWLAFSQNVGNSYQSAVDMLEDKSLSDEVSGRGEAMSSGEIQTKAALYALGTGLISAAIERSGGIQTLPDELRHGGDYWKIIVDSAVSEGKEEALQGILDRAMQNLMLDKGYKLVSLSDKEAVFSLPTAVEEFGTGAFVGGLLSGGQALAHGVLNPAKYAVNVDGDVAVNPTSAQTTVESVQPLTDRDIIDTTQLWMQQINEAAGVHSEEVQMVDVDGNQAADKNFVITTETPRNIEHRKPFDLQPTHSQTLSKTRMNALLSDLKANGIREPIKCVEYEGQLYVVDGHHRLLLAKRLGLTEVPVEIVELPYSGYSVVDDLLWFD